MTFADWYAGNVAPTIAQLPAPARQAARMSMAACWNAALDAVHAECGVWPEVSGGVNVNICRIGEVYLEEVLRAR